MLHRLYSHIDPDAGMPPRLSPVSYSANALTLFLLCVGIVASVATNFVLVSLPNILLIVVGILVLDILVQNVPRRRFIDTAQDLFYAFLYLVITIVCGILAAYALQRMAFPLQDRFLDNADKALGLDWLAYARWVDSHPAVQTVLYYAYNSISIQIALPAVVLACMNRRDELRVYLLAFSIAFVVTIVISATMPAAGPVVFFDRASFDILRFTGATPVDHLARLREVGPLVMAEFPGGIATFPSFHSTVAVLTPLALRRPRFIFVGLLLLNTAMLAGTITEGAHYFVDVAAGILMALIGYGLAKRLLPLEDRLLQNLRNRGNLRGAPTPASPQEDLKV